MSYATLKPEYDSWVANMVINRPGPVQAAVNRVLTSLDFYKQLSAQTNVPAVLLGAIDYREDDCNPNAGIGQGDPWNRVSVHVPRGKGPFASRLAADIYYVHYDGLDRPPAPYDLSVACYMAERYNGLGYRAHGKRSPYVVGGSNLQQLGKYVADGKWDGSVMDQQVGILPIMVRLIQMHPELAFGPSITGTTPPSVQPTVTPLPIDDKANTLTGAAWVQHSLNVLKAVPPDLAPLREDGIYGRRTTAAVKAFQIAHGLVADGIVGPRTVAAIDAALKETK